MICVQAKLKGTLIIHIFIFSHNFQWVWAFKKEIFKHRDCCLGSLQPVNKFWIVLHDPFCNICIFFALIMLVILYTDMQNQAVTQSTFMWKVLYSNFGRGTRCLGFLVVHGNSYCNSTLHGVENGNLLANETCGVRIWVSKCTRSRNPPQDMFLGQLYPHSFSQPVSIRSIWFILFLPWSLRTTIAKNLSCHCSIGIPYIFHLNCMFSSPYLPIFLCHGILFGLGTSQSSTCNIIQ